MLLPQKPLGEVNLSRQRLVNGWSGFFWKNCSTVALAPHSSCSINPSFNPGVLLMAEKGILPNEGSVDPVISHGGGMPNSFPIN